MLGKTIAVCQCVVFDFAHTLSCQPYFTPLGPARRQLVSEYLFGKHPQGKALCEQWMRGDVSASEVCSVLATELPLEISASELEKTLRQGARRMMYQPLVERLAKWLHQTQSQTGLKTALVSINADVFTQEVVPRHALDSLFNVVINSADYGTTSKHDLWPIAFKRLWLTSQGEPIEYRNSVLIDDGRKNVLAFSKRGGVVHSYSTDEKLWGWLCEQPWAEAFV